MQALELRIEEMGCNACVERVTRALTAVPGVQVDEVRVGSARVHLDPARTAPERIISVLEEAGYPARAVAPSDR